MEILDEFNKMKNSNYQPKIILVAACGPRGEMGLSGRLPWHQPADLAFFKKLTQGGVVICGRKTFESLPKLLPQRRHIIVSRQRFEALPTGVAAVSNWPELCQQLAAWESSEAFLIGGAEIYAQWGPHATACWITHFGVPCQADTFFPLEILRGRPILEQHVITPQLSEWPRTHVLYGPAGEERSQLETSMSDPK